MVHQHTRSSSPDCTCLFRCQNVLEWDFRDVIRRGLLQYVPLASTSTAHGLADDVTVLLCSALAIYSTNVRGVLAFLPSEPIAAGTPIGGPLLEALRSIAGSHMIIAVSLTGVMSLQAAQGYSDKPSV